MALAPSPIMFRLALLCALFSVASAGYPVPSAQAVETQSAAESGAELPQERPDAISAMVTARATARRVEDLSQRSETSQVFANPDGTWTSEAAAGPVRVLDEESGEWADIDTTLMVVEGGIAPTAAVGGLVSVGSGRTLKHRRRQLRRPAPGELLSLRKLAYGATERVVWKIARAAQDQGSPEEDRSPMDEAAEVRETV